MHVTIGELLRSARQGAQLAATLGEPFHRHQAHLDTLFEPMRRHQAHLDTLFEPMRRHQAQLDALFEPMRRHQAQLDALFEPMRRDFGIVPEEAPATALKAPPDATDALARALAERIENDPRDVGIAFAIAEEGGWDFKKRGRQADVARLIGFYKTAPRAYSKREREIEVTRRVLLRQPTNQTAIYKLADLEVDLQDIEEGVKKSAAPRVAVARFRKEYGPQLGANASLWLAVIERLMSNPKNKRHLDGVRQQIERTRP